MTANRMKSHHLRLGKGKDNSVLKINPESQFPRKLT